MKKLKSLKMLLVAAGLMGSLSFANCYAMDSNISSVSNQVRLLSLNDFDLVFEDRQSSNAQNDLQTIFNRCCLKKIEELKTKLKHIISLNLQLHKEIGELGCDFLNLREELEDKEKVISELKEKNDFDKINNEIYVKTSEELEKKIEQLKNEIILTKNSLEKNNEDNIKLKNDIFSLTRYGENLKYEKVELEKKIKELENNISESNDRVVNLRRDIENLQQENSKLKQNITELEKKEEGNEDDEKLKKTIIDLEKKNKELEKKNKELEKEKEEDLAKLLSMNDDYVKAQDTILRLENEILTLKKQLKNSENNKKNRVIRNNYQFN